MKRFKLGFGNRTILEQIAICRRVAHGISKLPASQPVAESVAAASDANAEVENLKTALRAALARRDAKVRAMRDHTTTAATIVATATKGEPAALLAAGVGVVKAKQPVGLPDAPTQLRVLGTDFEGKVRLRWKRPVRRCIFRVELTTDPAAVRGWKPAGVLSIPQTCEVPGLKSGEKYWFRVAASNAHGPGPWSQPVSARVK